MFAFFVSRPWVSCTPPVAHKKSLNSSETLNFLKFFWPIQTLDFFLTAFPDYSGDLSWGGFGRSGDLSWDGSWRIFLYIFFTYYLNILDTFLIRSCTPQIKKLGLRLWEETKKFGFWDSRFLVRVFLLSVGGCTALIAWRINTVSNLLYNCIELYRNVLNCGR